MLFLHLYLIISFIYLFIYQSISFGWLYIHTKCMCMYVYLYVMYYFKKHIHTYAQHQASLISWSEYSAVYALAKLLKLKTNFRKHQPFTEQQGVTCESVSFIAIFYNKMVAKMMKLMMLLLPENDTESHREMGNLVGWFGFYSELASQPISLLEMVTRLKKIEPIL